MMQIQLHIPKSIATLVGDERDRLLHSTLRIAAKRRVYELAKERREALPHIHRLERKYGVTFKEFERRKPCNLRTVQAHEDYADWFFWARVIERADRAIKTFKAIQSVQ